MIRRTLTALLLAAMSLIALPGTACACSCAVPEPTEITTGAAAIFTGTATAVEHVNSDATVFTFTVDAIYKGKPNTTLNIRSHPQSPTCGYNFTPGTRYLVFATDRESSTTSAVPGVPLHTDLCSGNRPIESGTPLRATPAGDPITPALLTALGPATPPTLTGEPPYNPTPPWWWYGAALAALTALGLTFWHLKRR
ncbi:hypothetical protein [Nonomuraea sp. NPDC046570]|uniref:hypothetical protein n=1 Tax=Nonomuraea sp. NPDC046570 TaxID=3155255 RepID=UPI0034083675